MSRDLADPIAALVPQNQPLTRSQAGVLAGYYNSQLVARILEEEGFTSEERLRILIDIARGSDIFCSIRGPIAHLRIHISSCHD